MYAVVFTRITLAQTGSLGRVRGARRLMTEKEETRQCDICGSDWCPFGIERGSPCHPKPCRPVRWPGKQDLGPVGDLKPHQRFINRPDST